MRNILISCSLLLLSSCGAEATGLVELLRLSEGDLRPKRQVARTERAAVILADDHQQWVLDSRTGEQPRFTKCSSLRLTVDGRRMAYVAQDGQREFAIVDRQRGEAFDQVYWVTFSDDGRHVQYRARTGKDVFVVGDAVKLGPFQKVGSHRPWRADGTLIFAARTDGKWYLHVGEDRFGPADAEGLLTLSHNGERYAWSAASAGRHFVLVDGARHGSFDGIGVPVWSPDGLRLIYCASSYEDGAEFLVENGIKRKISHGSASELCVSLDGKQIGYYVAGVDSGGVIIRNDTRCELPAGAFLSGDLMFDATGSLLGVLGFADGKVALWNEDGTVGPRFDKIYAIHRRKGGGVAYIARQDKQELVVDRQLQSSPVAAIRRLVTSPDGSALAWSEAESKHVQRVVFGDKVSQDFTWIGGLHLSSDGEAVSFSCAAPRTLYWGKL